MAAQAPGTLILLYALGANVVEKPDGIAISAAFIAGIIVVSLISRVTRTTELRVDRIEFDEDARRFIADSIDHDGRLDLVANKRQYGDDDEYRAKELEQRGMNPLPGTADILFLEIDVVDPSTFSNVLRVRGLEIADHRILRAEAPAAPNAIAAILLRAPRHHRPAPALSLRVVGGQPDRPLVPLPDPRPGRHTPSGPRDHPPARTRPRTTPRHPRRRLSEEVSGPGHQLHVDLSIH